MQIRGRYHPLRGCGSFERAIGIRGQYHPLPPCGSFERAMGYEVNTTRYRRVGLLSERWDMRSVPPAVAGGSVN